MTVGITTATAARMSSGTAAGTSRRRPVTPPPPPPTGRLRPPPPRKVLSENQVRHRCSRCHRGWPGCQACRVPVRHARRRPRLRQPATTTTTPTPPRRPTTAARQRVPSPRQPPRTAGATDRHPGAAEHARATVAASIRPVGVIPASAVQNASAQICGHSGVDSEVGSAPRSRSIVVRHPWQAPVADQKTPMALQQAFGDIGIPYRQGGRDELAGHARVGQHRCRQSRATPTRQPQPGHQQHLDHDAAVDEWEANATAKSCGRARGAASERPSAASDK